MRSFLDSEIHRKRYEEQKPGESQMGTMCKGELGSKFLASRGVGVGNRHSVACRLCLIRPGVSSGVRLGVSTCFSPSFG